MTLVSCPACNSQVSTEAATCPNCGHPSPGSKPAEASANFSESDFYWTGVGLAFVIVVVKNGFAATIAGFGLLAFLSWLYVIYSVVERLFR